MLKLLVYDDARRRFSTFRRAFDEVNTRLKTRCRLSSIRLCHAVVASGRFSLHAPSVSASQKVEQRARDEPFEKKLEALQQLIANQHRREDCTSSSHG